MTPLFIRLGVGKRSFVSKLAKLDWIGSAIFVASTTSFLIPLSWGGVMYPWESWHTLVPLIAGSLGIVGLYFYEGHWAANPIIRTSIFKNRNTAIAYINVILHGTVVTGSLYYLPLYYEAVKGLSPILSGVALFPETFTTAPGAFIVGALIARTNSYRWAIWSGWAITCLGLGLLYFLDVGTSTPQWIFINLTVGLGLGFNYVALGVMLQASTKEEDMTSAVAMFTFGRLLGQALGVVIGGVTFENQLREKLSQQPTLSPIAGKYVNDGAALAQLIGSFSESIEKTTLVQTYTDSLKGVWAVFCGLAGAALLSSLLVRGISLDREFVPAQQLGLETAVAGDGRRVVPEKSSSQIPSAHDGGDVGKSAPADTHRRSVRRQSRWYGAPGTVGSRPINGPRSTKQRTSSRYSKEIGGFHSFPTSIGNAQVYIPSMGHRPTSKFLPSIVHQKSLADLVETEFENVVKNARH